jgi:hypothetical protein
MIASFFSTSLALQDDKVSFNSGASRPSPEVSPQATTPGLAWKSAQPEMQNVQDLLRESSAGSPPSENDAETLASRGFQAAGF